VQYVRPYLVLIALYLEPDLAYGLHKREKRRYSAEKRAYVHMPAIKTGTRSIKKKKKGKRERKQRPVSVCAGARARVSHFYKFPTLYLIGNFFSSLSLFFFFLFFFVSVDCGLRIESCKRRKIVYLFPGGGKKKTDALVMR